MPDPSIISQVQRLPLCAPLSPAQIERLAGVFQRGEFTAGSVIFTEGSTARGLYLFVSGSGVLVRQTAQGEAEVGAVTAGQYINERALYSEIRETATLRVVEPAVVLLLARVNFLALLDQHPDIWLSLRSRSGSSAPQEPPKAPPASGVPVPSGSTPFPPLNTPIPSGSTPTIPPPPSGLGVTRPTGSTPVPPPPPIGTGVTIPTGSTPTGGVTVPTGSTPTIPAPPPIQQPTVPQRPLPSVGNVVVTPPAGSVAPNPTPTPTTFSGQHPNETILAQIWQHGWVFARHLWMPLALFLFFFGLSFVVSESLWAGVLSTLAIFFPGLWTLYLFIEWRNDHIIVTPERVIRVQQTLIPYRYNTTIVNIGNIHEVISEYPQGDWFSRLLNYGTVKLRTIGDAGDMTLTYIANPQRLQQLIFENRERQRHEVEQQRLGAVHADMRAILQGHPAQQPPPAPMTMSAALPPLNPFRTSYTDGQGNTVYRKHWLIWLWHVWLAGLLMILGVIAVLAALFSGNDLTPILVSAAFVPFIVGGVWFYLADWDWRNDLYIVGNDVVTLIHRRPLFLESTVDKVILAQVDSVVAEQNGILESLVDIGDVRLSLEGADRGDVKRFARVRNPRGVQAEIARRQARARQIEQNQQLDQQRQVVADYLNAYHRGVTGNPPPPSAIPPTDSGGTGRPPNIPKTRR